MRRPVFAAIGAACILMPGGSVLGAAAPSAMKAEQGWIEALSMDGRVVAYAVDREATGCHDVMIWSPPVLRSSLVSGRARGRCGDDEPLGQDVTDLAVAGKRVAWVRNITGNTESDDALYTAVPGQSQRLLARAMRTGDRDGVLAGNWIGGLVGDGADLRVNRWRSDAQGTIVSASLDAVTPLRLQPVVRGTETVLAASADSRRVAVLRSDGTVGLYAASGALLRTITPTSAREVALQKGLVVVLTKTRTLEVYDAARGSRTRSWPVPPGARHLDVHSGIAIFAVGRLLRAVRLSTGRDVVIASAGRAIVGAQIEAPGVVYAVNSLRRSAEIGTLVFLPIRRVAGAVS